jgi:hypothetical protein
LKLKCQPKLGVGENEVWVELMSRHMPFSSNGPLECRRILWDEMEMLREKEKGKLDFWLVKKMSLQFKKPIEMSYLGGF